MRRDNRQKQIALQIGIALMAGMFSFVPVTEGAPSGGVVKNGDVTISSANNTTSITDNITAALETPNTTPHNNVIDWQDFSVKQGETVQFDGGEKINNYMNVVSGQATSMIDGKISGGNEVYIINPNGVIFGEKAQVDVGSLYASTRYVSADDVAERLNATENPMTAMSSVLQGTTAGVAADVVNLTSGTGEDAGYIKADNVMVEGKNIRFYSDNVTNAAGTSAPDSVVLKAYPSATGRITTINSADNYGYIHIGNSTGTNTGLTNYASEALLANGSASTLEYYKLIDGSNWSTAINADLTATGKYMLSADIDASTAADFAPITSSFSGKIDGNFHEIKNISNANALFYSTNGATIENIGVADSSFSVNGTTIPVGAIVAGATNTTLNNVYNKNTSTEATIIGNDIFTGGLVGEGNGITIRSSYNTANVAAGPGNDGEVSGIVGNVTGGTNLIEDVYSTGDARYGALSSAENNYNNIINRVYTTGTAICFSGIVDTIKSSLNKTNSANSVYTAYDANGAVVSSSINSNNLNALSTYATTLGWGDKISNTGGVSINTTTGAVTRPTWRIYEGQTKPYLTSLLKNGGSTVSVNYSYNHDVDTNGAFITRTNSGKDLTAADITYNGQYVNVVDGTTSYSGSDTAANYNALISYGTAAGGNGVRNAKTQALFYTGQDGYDVAGGNVTMAPRTVSVSGASVDLSKVYDGVADATDRFIAAFNNSSGAGTTGGIVEGDTGVTVTFSDDFRATFNNKDVGDNKPVTLTGSLTLNDTTGNYVLDPACSDLSNISDATGSITKRTLLLNINPTSGINKTYDGSAYVSDTYAASTVITLDTTNSVEAGSTAAQATAIGMISGDTVSLASNDSRGYYVGTDNVTPTFNAGSHKVLYGGVALTGADAGNYQLQYTAAGATTPTTVENSQVLLDGTINRRLILSDSFQVLLPSRDSDGNIVRDADNNIVYETETQPATKIYDGTSVYEVPEYAKLSGSTASGGDTGIIEADVNNLWFALSDTANAYFTDSSGNETDMVADASNVAYQVDAVTRTGYDYLLGNYKIGTTASSVNIDSTEDMPFSVSGAGNIERRALTVSTENVANINKEYDGTPTVTGSAYTTMGSGYIDYANGTVDTSKLLIDSAETATDSARWNITASYDSKNVVRGTDGTAVDNGKTVNFTIAITGADAANYTLNGVNAESAAVTLTGTGKITPRDITPTFTTITKTYNGTRLINDGDSNYDASNPNGTVTGLTVGGVVDDVTLSYSAANASFDSKNAGSRTITYTGLSLTGADSGNYNLVNSSGAQITEATGAGVIDRRQITGDDINATFSEIAKTYDNTPTIENYADKLTSLTVNNVVDEELQFAVTSGAFASKDRRGGQDLQENGVNYVISLTDPEQLNNYTLVDGNGLSGTSLTITTDGIIYQKPITATITGAPSKTYDGTPTVNDAIGTLMTITGLEADGTTNATTAVYDSANAGARTVTYTLALNEEDNVNNYKFVDSSDGTTEITALTGDGEISKRLLGVSFGNISDIYYGDSIVTGTITPTVSNAVNAADRTAIETNLASGLTGVYGSRTTATTFDANPDVGTKDVQYSNLNTALGTTYSQNYEFASDTAYGSGEITQATISMSNFVFNFADVSKEYDGYGTVNITTDRDYVTDHYINVGTSGQVPFTYTINSATYNNKNVGTGKAVTYNITIDEPDLTNFTISDFNADYFNNRTLNVGTITAKPVYASVVGTVEKTYNADIDVRNGNTVLTGNSLVNIDGLITAVDSNTSTAAYRDANQGSNKIVDYTIAIDDGNNGNNYIVYDADNRDTQITSLSAAGNTINPRNLKLTFAPVTKTYDGTTSVPSGRVSYTFDPTSIQGSDVLGITSYDAAYNSPNVLEANTITYDNIVISGNDNGNYVLVGSDGTTPLSAGSNTTGSVLTTGVGSIERYTLTAAPTFGLNTVTKEYDTTSAVAYNRNTDLDVVKNAYITSSTVTINGSEQQLPFELTSARYVGATEADAASVAADKTVEFVIQLNSDNIDFGSYVTNGGTYTLTNTAAGTTAAITPRKVYVSLADTPDIVKTYDGNAGVSQDVSNMIIARDGDLLADGTDINRSLSFINAQYEDANAGTGKAVTYTVGLTGSNAGNYEIHRLENINDATADVAYSTLIGTGDIDKATLTLTPVDRNKTYNGTAVVGDGVLADDDALTADTLVLNGVNGESFTFSADALAVISGTYADANVSWNGEEVAYQDVLYTGLSNALDIMNADNSTNSISKNYTIADTVSGRGKIKPITITQAATENWKPVIREYNADTDLETVYDYSGGTVGNQLGIKDILQLTLTHNGNTVTDADGNVLTVDYEATGNYDNKNVDSTHVLNYHIDSVARKVTDSSGNANYVLDTAVVDALAGQDLDSESEQVYSVITPRQLNAAVVSATGNRKIYDGNDRADTSNFVLDTDDQNVLRSDNLLNNVTITATYDNANASAAPDSTTNSRTISYTLALEGGGNNYEIVTPTATAQGDIEQRKVYVDAVDVDGIDKIYDTTKTLPGNYSSNGRFVLRPTAADTGVVDGEDIALDFDAIRGAYASAHVQRDGNGSVIAQNINFDNFTLTGNSDTGNYIMATNSLTGSGTISPKALTVDIVAAPTKIYDGETALSSAYAANSNLLPDGLLGADSANLLIDSAEYADANAGTNKAYTYNLTLGNGDYELTQGAGLPTIAVTNNGLSGTLTANDGVITPRVLTAIASTAMTKEYDGTIDGVENAQANISLSNYIAKDKGNLGLTAVAVYDNANAGKSEDSDELQKHTVTYTLNLSNKNYQLADETITGEGTISRKGLTVVATPAAVNVGEAMPEFSGTVEGLIAKDSSLASLFTFAPYETTTSNNPGTYEVYGWYSNRTAGNLGLNYTFAQDVGNDTAFTVNYVNTNNDNPDTKITPNSDIYNQISKDMNSGFGDNGAAAIEYRDKQGNVVGTEAIGSGEIHGAGSINEMDAGVNSQDTKLANIGIVGGDIVNIEGADAAGSADIAVSGDGTVINLEVVPLQSEDANTNTGAAEITGMYDVTNTGNSMAEITGTDNMTNASAQIDDRKLENETEDKAEAKEKEGEIAIESSDSKDDDEIELKIEKDGVNVA